MASPQFRLQVVALVACLLASYLSVRWVQSGYAFEVEPPAFDVGDLPHAMGRWRGEDVEIADDTVRVLDSHSCLNRIYRDALGREVSIHVATWTTPEYGATAPHHPEVCYPAAGWEIMERRKVNLPSSSGEIPIELMLFQKGQEVVVTGHWYQSGMLKFTSSSEAQWHATKLWGAQSWPATTKILLQTRESSIDAASRLIMSLAQPVEEFVSTPKQSRQQ